MRLHFRVSGKPLDLEVHPSPDGYEVILDGKPRTVRLDASREPFRTAVVDGKAVRFGWAFAGGAHEIVLRGRTHAVALRDPRTEALAGIGKEDRGPRKGAVAAPIPGLVQAILVKVGAAVKEGEPLLTLDAMKLENEIPAPFAGMVKAIHVKPGQPVDRDALLITLG